MSTDKQLFGRLVLGFAQEVEELGMFAIEALDVWMMRTEGALGADDVPSYADDAGRAISGAAQGLAARMRFELADIAEDIDARSAPDAPMRKKPLAGEVENLVQEANRLGRFAADSLYDELMRANEAGGHAKAASYASDMGWAARGIAKHIAARLRLLERRYAGTDSAEQEGHGARTAPTQTTH